MSYDSNRFFKLSSKQSSNKMQGPRISNYDYSFKNFGIKVSMIYMLRLIV